ncbi:MAG TPA: transposase [Gemmatimonadales bacterium]|nr:transposase [Gemmatimonadales bacterium]
MPAHGRGPLGDLAAPGAYLVTTATAARRRLLAKVRSDGVTLLPIGSSVRHAWRMIAVHRPWIILGACTIMPDHLHGILSWQAVPPGRRGSLSVIMSGFKSEATRFARTSGSLSRVELLWQRSFHVVALRSESQLQRAERYISDNARMEWERIVTSDRWSADQTAG